MARSHPVHLSQNGVQDRCLAGPNLADDCDQRPGLNLDVQTLQHSRRPVGLVLSLPLIIVLLLLRHSLRCLPLLASAAAARPCASLAAQTHVKNIAPVLVGCAHTMMRQTAGWLQLGSRARARTPWAVGRGRSAGVCGCVRCVRVCAGVCGVCGVREGADLEDPLDQLPVPDDFLPAAGLALQPGRLRGRAPTEGGVGHPDDHRAAGPAGPGRLVPRADGGGGRAGSSATPKRMCHALG